MGDTSETKSERTFQCREYLFEVFDRMSAEYQCSVDYLINEAMREYALARDQDVRAPGDQASEPKRSVAADVNATKASTEPAPIEPTRSRAHRRSTRPTAQPAVPPPIPAPPRHKSTLTIEYNGQTFRVSKSEFIIGRGARTSDLAIRDSSVSRKHAAVVFEEGAHFITDLGSTNGVEFRGKRIHRRRIEEGDVYLICDHELRFTFETA